MTAPQSFACPMCGEQVQMVDGTASHICRKPEPAMTAPEPTPTAEHIDAVARVVADHDAPDLDMWPRAGARRIAEDVLTSTDPAVHAAMLDALVRAGVLTEDRERLVRACGCIANEEPAACCDLLASPHWERRHVTRWEVAP